MKPKKLNLVAIKTVAASTGIDSENVNMKLENALIRSQERPYPALRRRDNMDRAEFRQQAVLLAMQGLLAGGGAEDSPDEIAEAAVDYADALLEAMTVDEKEG
jgi:hypothetical protein